MLSTVQTKSPPILMKMKIIAGIALLISLAASEADESGNCSCGVAIAPTLRDRIVGGTNAKVNEFPLIGGIVRNSRPNRIFCGSTVITKRHTLTAAHCDKGVDQSVVFGEHDILSDSEPIVTIKIKQFIVHENWNEKGFTENDIALVYLAEDIPFGPTIGPACFPTTDLSKTLVGKKVRVVGWGLLYDNGPQPNILQKVDLDVVPLSRCTSKFFGVTNRQICTYTPKKDSCQGDSGGPVIYMDPTLRRYIIVGVVSFGDDCAMPDSPAVSTNVASYSEWIMQKIADTDPSAAVCSR